jgi:hypothetical protein
MIFLEKMDALNNNSLFNFGGWASIFSYAGIFAADMFSIASIDSIINIVLGLSSLIFFWVKIRTMILDYRIKKKSFKKNKDK